MDNYTPSPSEPSTSSAPNTMVFRQQSIKSYNTAWKFFHSDIAIDDKGTLYKIQVQFNFN